MRIAFFGSSEFALPILKHLARTEFCPEIVVTVPSSPAGRGRNLRPPPVQAAASALGIDVIQPESLLPVPPPLMDGIWDLFVVAAYGKIIPPECLSLPRSGSLNVHPSLLPRWRGPSPAQFSILNGDTETGVTVMLMDGEIDHGPILKNAKIAIENPKITAPELMEQLAVIGARLLVETIPEWIDGGLTPRPQEHGEATRSKLLKREDGHIVWSGQAVEIERKIRAFQPWPGAFTFWHRGKGELRLSLGDADVMAADKEGRAPGTVVDVDGRLGVQASDGMLVIERIKAEGGIFVGGQEFLRGHPDITGAILT